MSETATQDAIVSAADGLFYRQGFAHTSFADIADAVGISRGNFYYHFKSKDAILTAVITRRRADTRAMLAGWEAESPNPAERIKSFIRILITNRETIMDHGCPVGTLCAELAKLNHAAQGEAAGIFTLFREWLRRQFAALGHGAQADALALRVLAFSQGGASLANAFRDEDFVRREVDRMCDWLDALTPAGASDAEKEGV